MSETASSAELWSRHDSPAPARERLRKVVGQLTWARRLQLLVDHAFAGLFIGLCLATLVLLASKLVATSLVSWRLAGVAVLGAVAVAVLVGWLKRPNALQVVIRADVALRLKQRMSTAWELMGLDGDSELGDRLAVQAVKAGLPARPQLVFPLRVNRWGRLAPLAATALLLVAVVDLAPLQGPAAGPLDERVAAEGERLAQFARAMQARSEREELPRSAKQAAEIERLGARMESGALSRSEALQQLRALGDALDEERKNAQAQAGAAGNAPAGAGSGLPADIDPKGLRQRMAQGNLDGADRRALTRGASDLERAGIPRRELENALTRHEAGDDAPLDEILQKLAQVRRALAEDKELRDARNQVLRSRDNLGDPQARSESGKASSSHLAWDDEEGESGGAPGGNESTRDSQRAGQFARQQGVSGSHGNSSNATDDPQVPYEPEPPPPSAPVLSAQGQLREGEMRSTEGRTLPRTNRANVAEVPLRPEYAARVEQALAGERYPAHYKEFMRRYFLSLSQGEGAAPAPPPEERGTP